MLRRLARVALQAVEPKHLMQAARLPAKARRVYVVGAGKATAGMAAALHKKLGKKIVGGYINVPVVYQKKIGRIHVQKAAHPFPDVATVTATKKIYQLLRTLGPNDVVIGLWSGGGSSLFALPRPGLTVAMQNRISKTLMRSGANIVELNTVRKHLSLVKGGQLALVTKAHLINYVISDVIGDPLDVIASGPTVVDRSTIAQARRVLKKYHLYSKKLDQILSQSETPKHLDRKRISSTLIGSNRLALQHVVRMAKKFNPHIFTTTLHGEARQVAKRLVNQAKRIKRRPMLLLAGGETTVTVRGKGYGGRNQEFALAALPHLQPGMSLLSLATDGIDGFTPKPVAGALVRYGQYRPEFDRYLANNDSYTALKKIGALLHTGPTGTNVGDIVMIMLT